MEIPFVQGKQIQIYKVMIFDVFNKKKKEKYLILRRHYTLVYKSL